MVGVQSELMICRGELEYLRLHFKIFTVDGSMIKLMSKSDFSHISSLVSDLKGSYMGWEVKSDFRGQSKHGLWGSNVKTGKYLPGADRSKLFVHFWAQNI